MTLTHLHNITNKIHVITPHNVATIAHEKTCHLLPKKHPQTRAQPALFFRSSTQNGAEKRPQTPTSKDYKPILSILPTNPSPAEASAMEGTFQTN